LFRKQAELRGAISKKGPTSELPGKTFAPSPPRQLRHWDYGTVSDQVTDFWVRLRETLSSRARIRERH